MFQDQFYPNLTLKGAGGEEGEAFGRMFPDLPSFAEGQDPTDVIARLRELGRKGGLMDALDPKITVTNPLDANLLCDASDINVPCNPDNPNAEMTVGFTFLGQFLDHDITFDPAPLPGPATNGPNLRTPLLDLDSVYGRGPDEDRVLYDRTSELDRPAPAKFLIDLEAARDLPRTSEHRAIIADPRNDENVIISQLQLAFLKFHNRVVDWVVDNFPNESPDAQFERAQKTVRWHYQYIVVNQFLRVSLDPEVFEDVRDNGPTIYEPSDLPMMPREFQIAAYRFGHTQIRPGYKINIGFGAPIFDATIDPREGDPNDLRGGRRAERRFVEWDVFFDFGTLEVAPTADGQPATTRPKVKRNKRIDPFISSPMFDLPVGPGLVGPGDEKRSLAGRNLERHLKHDVPSGQAIADELGYPKLTAAELAELENLNFHESTPLWYYVLKEALVQHQGKRLGKVGSRILAEVFFGLLLSDPESYWSTDRDWEPDLPRRNGTTAGDFTMTDLLTFAGVA
ncbi:MAG TPA: heme peroxidase family protein [Microvirga sp.]|jgi:hypothetical protein|nr:heme peroxidase family protein [Microvirga sp.]